jgi:hypothetical protein
MSKPTYLRFYLEHNDDEELTCFFCSLPKCEQMFEARGGGQVKFVGVHNSCAEKHMDKILAAPKGSTNGVG